MEVRIRDPIPHSANLFVNKNTVFGANDFTYKSTWSLFHLDEYRHISVKPGISEN